MPDSRGQIGSKACRLPGHGLVSTRCWLAGLLPQVFTPVQIIAGRNDPVVPVADAEFLHARLPNSRLDVLGTGHLACEEAPGRYAAIINAWINGGYLTGNTGMGRT